MMDEGWYPYHGENVLIRWRNLHWDWPTYRVVAVDGHEAWLRGIDDGPNKHLGDSFVAHEREVYSIERLPASPSGPRT